MEKHTPGPWRLAGGAGDGYALIGADNSVTCDTGFATTVDARLIAAAPELLEALKAFLRAPSSGSSGPGYSTIEVTNFNFKAARAAIEKAEVA